MSERREPVRLHIDATGFTKAMEAAVSNANNLTGRLRYLADAAAVLGPMRCACLPCRFRRIFRRGR